MLRFGSGIGTESGAQVEWLRRAAITQLHGRCGGGVTRGVVSWKLLGPESGGIDVRSGSGPKKVGQSGGELWGELKC